MQYILDQLIICAGQYKRFEEQQYSLQFNYWLKELQKRTGKNEEQALDIFVGWVNGEEVAA